MTWKIYYGVVVRIALCVIHAILVVMSLMVILSLLFLPPALHFRFGSPLYYLLYSAYAFLWHIIIYVARWYGRTYQTKEKNMSDQKLEQINPEDNIPFNGSFVAMEESTLASLGLDPEKATELDTKYDEYRRNRPNVH
jgi:hypothetical protein